MALKRDYPTGRFFEGCFPRPFVPGYDRIVTPGHLGTPAALNAEMSKPQTLLWDAFGRFRGIH